MFLYNAMATHIPPRLLEEIQRYYMNHTSLLLLSNTSSVLCTLHYFIASHESYATVLQYPETLT
jgi:hypothetical protein